MVATGQPCSPALPEGDARGDRDGGANPSATAHMRSLTDEQVHPGLVDLLAALGIEVPILREQAATLEEEKPESSFDNADQLCEPRNIYGIPEGRC